MGRAPVGRLTVLLCSLFSSVGFVHGIYGQMSMAGVVELAGLQGPFQAKPFYVHFDTVLLGCPGLFSTF